jgi:hypothetical protein
VLQLYVLPTKTASSSKRCIPDVAIGSMVQLLVQNMRKITSTNHTEAVTDRLCAHEPPLASLEPFSLRKSTRLRRIRVVVHATS